MSVIEIFEHDIIPQSKNELKSHIKQISDFLDVESILDNWDKKISTSENIQYILNTFPVLKIKKVKIVHLQHPDCFIIRDSQGYFCNTHNRYVHKWKWNITKRHSFTNHYNKVLQLKRELRK